MAMGKLACFRKNRKSFDTVRKVLKEKEGVAIIEAAYLYPVVILIIAALLIAGTVWYQKAYFKSLVNRSVQSISFSVTKPPNVTANLNENGASFLDLPVYYSVETLNERIEREVRKNMEKGLERYVIYSFNEPITIRTQIVNRVFYKDLLVEVTIPCKVPFGFVFGTTDSEGNLLFHEKISVLLPATAELVWQIDLVEDSLKRLGLDDKKDQFIASLTRPLKMLLEKMY
jgi:hypothetical protein